LEGIILFYKLQKILIVKHNTATRMEIQNLSQLPPSTLSIKIVTLLGRQYLLVPDQSKIRRVLVTDIVRLEGVKNYTLLHLRN
jgi:hypothetical protein